MGGRKSSASFRNVTMTRTAGDMYVPHTTYVVHKIKCQFSFMKIDCYKEKFARKFSVTHDEQREMELGIEFEFLSKQEMSEEHGMTACLV